MVVLSSASKIVKRHAKRANLLLHWASAWALVLYVVLEYHSAPPDSTQLRLIRVLAVVAALDVVSAAVSSILHRLDEIENRALQKRIDSANMTSVLARREARRNSQQSMRARDEMTRLKTKLYNAKITDYF